MLYFWNKVVNFTVAQKLAYRFSSSTGGSTLVKSIEISSLCPSKSRIFNPGKGSNLFQGASGATWNKCQFSKLLDFPLHLPELPGFSDFGLSCQVLGSRDFSASFSLAYSRFRPFFDDFGVGWPYPGLAQFGAENKFFILKIKKIY